MNNTLTVRVITRSAPAKHQGRLTEFGLQDKQKNVDAGVPRGKNLVFTAQLVVKANQKVPASFRFGGPYVHGSDSQFLYVGWRFPGESTWINRLKVALDLDPQEVRRALANGSVLETDGTAPRWGVLKDWHGLGVGKKWSTIPGRVLTS